MLPGRHYEEPSSSMANILVVEDNDDVREMMAVTLELEGHEVATAVNGRDALNKLHKGEKPCLILLDLMMPVMNGWEFQYELEHDPDPALREVPVVVVSAATADMMRKTEAAAYLPKPIDLDRLLDVVVDFCDHRRTAETGEKER
jgi:CheY-like chemotaxis protein